MVHRQGIAKLVFGYHRPETKNRMLHWAPDAVARSTNAARTLLAMLGLLLMFSGCRPAQIGPSDEVLGAVDALYTAVASRRIELLDKSAARLEELHTSGELPDAAHRQLKSYIEKSRAGKWDAAVRELHEFIRGQRRAKS